MITRTDPRTRKKEAHSGRCGAHGCSCGAFVESSSNIAGWPSCARANCRHTEHVHEWVEVAA